MFLHSGASLHGHEYSNRPANQHLQPGHRRSPLIRSAFAPPTHSTSPSTTASSLSHTTSSAASTNLTSGTSSPASIVRSSTFSDGIRPSRPLRPKPHLRHTSDGFVNGQRPPEPVVRFHDPVVVEPPVLRTLPTTVSQSPTPSKLRSQVKPQEPMSEDESSFSASEASYASDHVSGSVTSSKPARRRRAPRKSTTFLFCHPAPKLSSKKPLLKRLRPTLLMQLQQLSPDRRPLPVIDVYPSSLIAGNVVAPRFNKHFPRLFGINGELGLHDTILVRSEDYDSRSLGSESEGEDDGFEHRTLLAVLSPLRRGDRSEIVLEDGTVWVTTPLPTGSFDFVKVDENGRTTTARWVRRVISKPSPATPAAPSKPHEDGTTTEPECKFTFSIIDPQSRRHPILATLTTTTLDILDHYTTVSPSSSSRYPPSRSWTRSPASHDADASNDEEQPPEGETGARSEFPFTSATIPASKGRTTIPVDAALKEFISITAIWVALQCGWAQSPPGGPASCTPVVPNSNVTKSVSGSLSRLSEKQKGEMANTSEVSDSRGRNLLSRTRGRAATASSLDGHPQDRDQSPSLSPRALLRTPLFPRKASSTGAAFVQRRNQLQMSDTSDSERAPVNTNARRSRTFSRLSGDFTSRLPGRYRQSPSPPEATSTRDSALAQIPSSSSIQPASTTTTDPRSVVTPALPRGGRSVSAYYATNPLASSDEFDGSSELQGSARTQSIANHETSSDAWQHRPGSVAERGANTRWKKLGNWFKRLGGH